MNDLERQLHYPFGEALAPTGGTLTVAPTLEAFTKAVRKA